MHGVERAATLPVELFGPYGARHDFHVVDFNGRKSPKDPLGPLARLLIREGFDPSYRMHIVRDGVPIFKRDRKLSAWAGEDWIDTQTRVAVRTEYRPFVRGSGISEAARGPDVECTVPT
ncbi:hypothetical protein ACVILI_001892 [Mesorhizobium sp. USDA 4775]